MEFTPKIAPTFTLYVRMMLGMGLVFELPTLVLFLARVGLVTPRFLIRNTKYAILIIFVIAGGHHHAWPRRRVAGARGRPDVRPVPSEHRYCLDIPTTAVRRRVSSFHAKWVPRRPGSATLSSH